MMQRTAVPFASYLSQLCSRERLAYFVSGFDRCTGDGDGQLLVRLPYAVALIAYLVPLADCMSHLCVR